MQNAPKYTPEVGRKFYADGSAREFPGNTIICFVDPASEVYRLCCWLLDRIRALPFAHKLAPLPPSSLHMTVFELLCDQVRLPEKWSANLALNTPLEQTDEFFMRVVPQVNPPATFYMRYQNVNHRLGVSITLAPVDEAVAGAIRAYRDDISRGTGVRFADQDTYRFHISLAYRLMELEPAEQAALAAMFAECEPILQEKFGVFQTGQPQLVFFDDMFRFVPQTERHTLSTRKM
jgi:hypothetical protein